MMLRENVSDHDPDTGAVATRLEELASPTEGSRGARKRAPAFGGREDIAEVYRTAKNLIYTHKLWLLKQFEEEAGIKRLTICNLWRIERHPDSSLRTLEFSLVTGEWTDADSLKEWPQIPIWPFAETRKCAYWTEIIKAAIWKALVAAGYNDLPKFLNPIPKKAWERHIKKFEKKGYLFRKDSRTWSVKIDTTARRGWYDDIDYKSARLLGLIAPKGYKREMTPSRMAYGLIDLFVGRTIRRNGKKDRNKKGRLPVQSQEKGARALRAAFFEHIKEREIMSAMLAIDREQLPFLHYIDWAKNRREPLLRVAAEQRNLLPLLALIQFKHWRRTDLFSRSLWVRGTRKTTVVDRSGFTVTGTRAKFSSFDNKAAWRWLSNAPFRAVERWAERKNTALATNLALACSNVGKKIPVVALVRLIEGCPDFRRDYRDALPEYGVSPVIQQLYRLYLAHAAQLWEEKGFKAVLDWAGRHRGAERFSTVIDYLEAEGFQQGQPDRNATWASLMRRSDDWHRRVAIENIEASGDVNQAWVSIVGNTSIDDIEFMPLATSRDLAVEGYELGHCVGQYTSWCVKGSYRVFSVREPDGTRSTLGLQIRRKKVSIEQHRSRFNGAVSPAAEAAGREMAKLYQSALSLRPKAISPSTSEAKAE